MSTSDSFRYGFRIYHSLEEAWKNPLSVKRLSILGKSWNYSETSLQDCSEFLKQAVNLREFKVGWQSWTELPEVLGRLKNLRRVIALNIPIASFPEFLTACPKLTELCLRGTDIPAVPASIGKFQSLTRLDLSNNPISMLPDEISNLHRLKSLTLHSVPLSKPSSDQVRSQFGNVAFVSGAKS